MKTPDLTKAQTVAVAQSVLAVLVSFGVPMTDVQIVAVMGLVTAVSGILIYSDTRIREERNRTEQTRMSVQGEENVAMIMNTEEEGV